MGREVDAGRGRGTWLLGLLQCTVWHLNMAHGLLERILGQRESITKNDQPVRVCCHHWSCVDVCVWIKKLDIMKATSSNHIFMCMFLHI